MSSPLDIDATFNFSGDGSIRMSPGNDPRASMVDVVMSVTGKSNDDAGKIIRDLEANPDRKYFFTNVQRYHFKGRGVREQYVLTASECWHLVNILPGENAIQFRIEGSKIVTRFWAGDVKLIAEIKDNMLSDGPLQQFARIDVENNMGYENEKVVHRHTEALEKEAFYDQMIAVDCGYELKIATYKNDMHILNKNLNRVTNDDNNHSSKMRLEMMTRSMDEYKIRLSMTVTEEEKTTLRGEYVEKTKKIADGDVGNAGTASLIASRGISDVDGTFSAKIDLDIAKRKSQEKRKAESEISKTKTAAKKADIQERKEEKEALKESAEAAKAQGALKKKQRQADIQRTKNMFSENKRQEKRDAASVGR
jgi:hypothetical protein